ncbi:hypothetical protein [Candidatus Solirubrobacter pratensis]|uniref:hypothetical protein n=1 Tax=Candidatus Solirubrobacter pratensis TaxID=1298857 RepID=UPI0012DF2FA5|nr:hypothetical protein [Candidatus Solirubrobacter pratensis]
MRDVEAERQPQRVAQRSLVDRRGAAEQFGVLVLDAGADELWPSRVGPVVLLSRRRCLLHPSNLHTPAAEV